VKAYLWSRIMKLLLNPSHHPARRTFHPSP
jgi:hypothetical protein